MENKQADEIRRLADGCFRLDLRDMKTLCDMNIRDPSNRVRRIAVMTVSLHKLKQESFASYQKCVQDLKLETTVLRSIRNTDVFTSFTSIEFFSMACQSCLINTPSRMDIVVQSGLRSFRPELVYKSLFMAIVSDANIHLFEHYRSYFPVAEWSSSDKFSELRMYVHAELAVENVLDLTFLGVKKFMFYFGLLKQGWKPSGEFFKQKWLIDLFVMYGMDICVFNGIRVVDYRGNTIVMGAGTATEQKISAPPSVAQITVLPTSVAPKATSALVVPTLVTTPVTPVTPTPVTLAAPKPRLTIRIPENRPIPIDKFSKEEILELIRKLNS
jgi:hypothetical protein